MSDSEVRAIVRELDDLMAELKGSVAALQAILTTEPEASGEPAAT